METVHDGPLTADELEELQWCINSDEPWRGYIVTFIDTRINVPAYDIDLSRVIVKGIKCDN